MSFLQQRQHPGSAEGEKAIKAGVDTVAAGAAAKNIKPNQGEVS